MNKLKGRVIINKMQIDQFCFIEELPKQIQRILPKLDRFNPGRSSAIVFENLMKEINNYKKRFEISRHTGEEENVIVKIEINCKDMRIKITKFEKIIIDLCWTQFSKVKIKKINKDFEIKMLKNKELCCCGGY